MVDADRTHTWQYNTACMLDN